MSLINDISKITLVLDGQTIFQGNLVKLIKGFEEVGGFMPDKPPKESLLVSIGKMYVIKVFQDKTILEMNINIAEFHALTEMLLEALADQMPDEMKPLAAITKACVPTKMTGSYTAEYPSGKVIVTDDHVTGYLSIPFGLDMLNAQISADEERNKQRALDALDQEENQCS